MKKKLRALTLSLALILAFTALTPLSSVSAKTTAISISKSKATVKVGSTLKLKVNGTTAKAKWSSSKKDVATVNNKGLVKGIRAGKTVISAKIGNKAYKCNVTVKNGYNDLKKFIKKKGQKNPEVDGHYFYGLQDSEAKIGSEFGFASKGDEFVSEFIQFYYYIASDETLENQTESISYEISPFYKKNGVDHYISYHDHATDTYAWALYREDGKCYFFDPDTGDEVSAEVSKRANELTLAAIADWKDSLDNYIKIPAKSLSDLLENEF